jgi:hypothetical protein
VNRELLLRGFQGQLNLVTCANVHGNQTRTFCNECFSAALERFVAQAQEQARVDAIRETFGLLEGAGYLATEQVSEMFASVCARNGIKVRSKTQQHEQSYVGEVFAAKRLDSGDVRVDVEIYVPGKQPVSMKEGVIVKFVSKDGER